MKRALFLSVAISVAAFSADSTKAPVKQQAPTPDIEMSPQAHEPLFRPKLRDGGTLTQQLTAGMASPKPGGRVIRRNFIDEEIFGRMERDGVPHAPLATDAEFVRRAPSLNRTISLAQQRRTRQTTDGAT